MYVERSEMSDVQPLRFNYTLESFKGDSLEIKISFAEGSVVSTQSEPDYLVLNLTDFRDENDKLISGEYLVRRALPTQISPGLA